MRKSISKRLGLENALKSVRNLPKMARARGLSTNRPGTKKKATKAKDIKKKLSVVPPKRKPAPAVSSLLEKVLESDFVLVLGKDLTVALSVVAKALADQRAVGDDSGPVKPVEEISTEIALIYESLVKLIKNEEKKAQLTTLLSETSPAAKGEALVEVREILVAELGYARVVNYISKALQNRMEEYYGNGELPRVEDMPFKLIKALGPKVIIYEGYDKFFEQQFAHENLPLLSVTNLDILNGSVDLSNSATQTILKINGDVEKPDLVPLNKEEKFKAYGLKPTGEPIEDCAMFTALKALAAKMSFVFLGCSLSDAEPLAQAMKALNDKEEARHFALVTEISDGAIKRYEGKEIGVEYATFLPDADFSHIVEFMANMAQSKSKSISEGLSKGAVISKAFVFSQCGPDYIKGVAEKEAEAESIAIYANDLIHLSLISDAKYTETLVLPDIKRKVAEAKSDVKLVELNMEAITDREKVFTDKLLTDTSSVVRVMAPKKAVIAELSQSMDDIAISKYTKIIETIEASHGQFQLKLVDEESRVARDFEILFLKGNGSFADVCLVNDTEKSHFTVNWFGMNTNEAEEKTLLFERYWSVALSMKESKEYMMEMLEAAKTGTIKEVIKATEPKKETSVAPVASLKTEEVKAEEEKKLEEKKGSKNHRNFVEKLIDNVKAPFNKKDTKKEESKPAEEKKVEKKEGTTEKVAVVKAAETVEAKKVVKEETPKAEAKKVEAKKEEPKKAEVKKVAPKKAEAKKEVKKAAPKKEVKKAAPKKDVKKAEPKKVAAKKEEPKKVEVKKEEPKKVEVKKVETKKEEVKKEEPKKVEAKKEEPKVEAKKEEVKKEEPKKEVAPVKAEEKKLEAKKSKFGNFLSNMTMSKKKGKTEEPKKEAPKLEEVKKEEVKKEEPKATPVEEPKKEETKTAAV